MNVTLNRMAVSDGYYLCWYTPIIGNGTDVRRHEEHLGTPEEFEVIARLLGWTPNIGKTFVEYLDMATDDWRQDIPNSIDAFDLPHSWKDKVVRTFPDLPHIFVFRNDDKSIWIGWTIKKADNHLVNHQYRLDTPEELMETAEGFGWKYDGPGYHGDLLDAQEYLEEYIENETNPEDGSPPDNYAMLFPLKIQMIVASTH